MAKRSTFDQVVRGVFMVYIFLLPMAFTLMVMGDWQIMAVNSSVLLLVVLVDTALEGPLQRAENRR